MFRYILPLLIAIQIAAPQGQKPGPALVGGLSKRPPPPPEEATRPECTSGRGRSKKCSLWEWMYCPNHKKWVRVTKETCPAIFNDRDLSDYSSICTPGGPLTGDHTPCAQMWTFTFPPFDFHFCPCMPCCFCPACCTEDQISEVIDDMNNALKSMSG